MITPATSGPTITLPSPQPSSPRHRRRKGKEKGRDTIGTPPRSLLFPALEFGLRVHEEAAAVIVVVAAQQRHLGEGASGDRRADSRHQRRLLVEQVRHAEQEGEALRCRDLRREAVVRNPWQLEDRAVGPAAQRKSGWRCEAEI